MRVALLVVDPLPLPGEPATPAGLRAWHLALGLRARAGFEVVVAAPPIPDAAPIPWVHRVERTGLAAWLSAQAPDVAMAGDWRLVASLGRTTAPLAVDIATWPFDEAAIGNEALAQWRAFAAALSRADQAFFATDALRGTLAPFVGAAALGSAPPLLPLVLPPDAPPPAADRNGRRLVVFGKGRGSECLGATIAQLDAALGRLDERRVTLVCPAGTPYPPPGELPTGFEIVSAPDFSALLNLLRMADAAMVLPAASSGAAAAPLTWETLCLWAGVPVMLLEDNELARALVAAKAGWLIAGDDEPAMRRALAKAMASPSDLAKRAAAAHQYARAHLTWAAGLESLVTWCQTPTRRTTKVSFDESTSAAPPLRHGESRETPLGRITLHLEPPMPPAHPPAEHAKSPEPTNGGRPLTIPNEPGERVLSPAAVLVALPVGLLLLGLFVVLETVRSVVAPPPEKHPGRR